MSQYDSYAEELQDHSSAPLLCPDIYHADNYTFCNWATSVSGYDVNAGAYVLYAVTCKRWGCPYCAVKKIRRLAWMSRNAEPTRLLTLTISSKRYVKDEHAWQAMSAAYPELIRWVRTQVGECEYLRVLELQANGTPHFHCMLRAPYIVHRDILHEWRRLIGQPDDAASYDDRPKEWAGVNLKRIDSSFRTFNYLVKYLTKLHKIPWTDRHVSYSRNFFRDEDKEQVAYAVLDDIQKYDQHPWVWLQERIRSGEVRVLDHGKWLLGPEIPEPDPWLRDEVDPRSLGLPGKAPDPSPPPVPLTQRLVPGLEAEPALDDNLRPDGRRKRASAKRAKVWPPPPTQPPSPEGPF